ncbi:MAG: hypothetical protein OIF47_14995 [Marinibacterium sp.]|nr:hypothetical protein [Marinibacterium sp.]
MHIHPKVLSRVAAMFLSCCALGSVPGPLAAETVPDQPTQGSAPIYVACMMAVSDAPFSVRDALEATCIRRMGDLCSGPHGAGPPSQIIACLTSEIEQGRDVLIATAEALPATVERQGFFGHSYARHRSDLMARIADLSQRGAPQSVAEAIEQAILMAGAVTTLFWLARETQTPVVAP